MIDDGDRVELLGLARRSIARGLAGRHHEMPLVAGSPLLLESRATFTTLKLDGELRGCCGTIEPQRPLAQDVWHSAWSSAYSDPRFWPVGFEEVERLEISISVLTALQELPVRDESELIETLAPGVDGLLLCCGAQRATFLPAVWRSLPDPTEFVAELKRKAGWPASAWPAGITAFRYQTESFGARGRNSHLP